jgi:hypothetical protein
MIRNLPEGSRFTAAMTVDRADEVEDLAAEVLQDPDPRREAVMDHRAWTMDRRLMATAINAIYSQIHVSGNWGKEGPPDFPVIGPAAWQPNSKQSSEPKDNFDVLRKMGWPGG